MHTEIHATGADEEYDGGRSRQVEPSSTAFARAGQHQNQCAVSRGNAQTMAARIAVAGHAELCGHRRPVALHKALGPTRNHGGHKADHKQYQCASIAPEVHEQQKRGKCGECKYRASAELRDYVEEALARLIVMIKNPLRASAINLLNPNHVVRPTSLRRLPLIRLAELPSRSEERREGKECRSRWSP